MDRVGWALPPYKFGDMLKFILKRLLWGIPVLWAVATITFIIMHIVPGGPFDEEKQLPPEIKANIEQKYYLDRPLSEQYILYLWNLLKGDLGPSYKYLGRTVSDIIADTFPASIDTFSLMLALSTIFKLSVENVNFPSLTNFNSIKSFSIFISGNFLYETSNPVSEFSCLIYERGASFE